MRFKIFVFAVSLISLSSLTGCGSGGTDNNADNSNATNNTTNTSENGAHAHDDELFWQMPDVEHEGMVLKLGHHGEQLFAAHDVEVAVSIVRDDKPVEDAKVFVTLLDTDGETVVGAEKPTKYEPTTEDEEAHYAQARFEVPAGAKRIVLRYRIEFAGDVAEFTKDVPIRMGKHD